MVGPPVFATQRTAPEPTTRAPAKVDADGITSVPPTVHVLVGNQTLTRYYNRQVYVYIYIYRIDFIHDMQ